MYIYVYLSINRYLDFFLLDSCFNFLRRCLVLGHLLEQHARVLRRLLQDRLQVDELALHSVHHHL